MNLLARILGPLALSALFLSSCEDPNDIGLNLNEDKDILGVNFIEIPLTTSVFLADSISTFDIPLMLGGRYADQAFGTTEAVSFANFIPTRSNPNIPADAVLDSVVVNLRVRYRHGVNFNQDQSFTIYQLTDTTVVNERVRKREFYSFQEEPYSADPLGSTSFLVNPLKDTILVRVKIDDPDFLEQLKTLSNQYIITSDSVTVIEREVLEFGRRIRGFALVPGPSNSVILGFAKGDPMTVVTLYYHTAATASTLNYRFNANYTSVTTDRTGTPLAGLTQPYEEIQLPNGAVYLQDATGVIPKVNFDAYIAFLDTAGTIMINHAEFAMRIQPSPSTYVEAPSQIVHYLTDESNELLPRSSFFGVIATDDPPKSIQTEEIYQRILGESQFFNDSTFQYANPQRTALNSNRYISNLTLFLQRVSEGRSDLTSFAIYPRNYTPDLNFPLTMSQFKAEGNDISLKIYYTKLKK